MTALETAQAWLAADEGDVSLVDPSTTADSTAVRAGGRATVLPEFALWDARCIAQLGAALLDAQHDINRIVGLSDCINMAIVDQVDARGLGSMFTYAQQCEGERVHDLIPRPGHENENSNAGRISFGAHSDDAILEDEFRVDNLLLVGVHNPDSAPTILFPVDGLVAHLPPRTVRVLSQPRFEFACPESFNVDHRESIAAPGRAVLFEADDGFHIRFATYSTRAGQGDAVAAQAVEELCAAISAITPTTVVLQPGTMLTFSNSRFLHGRGEVAGRRWVKRCYLKRDLTVLERTCRTRAAAVFDLRPAIDGSLKLAS